MAHLLPLLSALRTAGAGVRLLCLGDGGLADAARDRNLPTTVLPMAHPGDVRVLAPLRRELQAMPWDVLHTHGMRANLPVRVLAPGLQRRPCLFTTVHSDLLLDYRSPARARLYGVLDRWTARRVDQVVCVSGDLRRRLLERGYDRGRVIVVHSGLEGFEEGPAGEAGAPGSPGGPGGRRRARAEVARAVWRGNLPPAQAPRFGTLARLVPVKDLDLFLAVAAVVRVSLPGVRIALIGDGPQRERLAEIIRERGLEPWVTLSGEVRPGREALRELDVFLLTSVSEGIPMSVLEAMAAGLPVVATRVGGMPEVVEEGVTGYLVARDGETEAIAATLARRVTELLIDADLRRSLGEAGRHRVETRFSASAAAGRLLAAYERCLAGRGRFGFPRPTPGKPEREPAGGVSAPVRRGGREG